MVGAGTAAKTQFWEGRAQERNEKQILNWQKKDWPELKKKHAEKVVSSSSSTKAD